MADGVPMKNPHATNAHNENEPFPFQTLAAATARLLEKQKERTEENGNRDDKAEKDEARRLEYVGRRLRDIAEFEARASGMAPQRRRKK